MAISANLVRRLQRFLVIIDTKAASNSFRPRSFCNASASFGAVAGKRRDSVKDSRILPLAEFLEREYGLCESQICKLTQNKRHLSRVSMDSVQEAVRFLTECGFTADHIKRIVVRNPRILSPNVDFQSLKSRLDLFESQGFCQKDSEVLLSKRAVFWRNRESQDLDEKLRYLENICGGKAALIKAVRGNASLLVSDLEKSVKPVVEFLQNTGIDGESLSYLIKSNPKILSCTVSKVESCVNDVKGMGFVMPSKDFVRVLGAISGVSSAENMEERFEVLKEFGLSRQHFLNILTNGARVLYQSPEKLKNALQFLVNVVELPPHVVAKYSKLLGSSVEGRLKRRYEIFKLSKQTGSEISSLVSVFVMSERRFHEVFVQSSLQLEKGNPPGRKFVTVT